MVCYLERSVAELNMSITTTEFSQESSDVYSVDMRSVRAEYANNLNPVMMLNGETFADGFAFDPEKVDSVLSEKPRMKFSPPMANTSLLMVNPDSTPLQIWEGTVLEVDDGAGVMKVMLDAKIGKMPRHSGEIDLDSVSQQDQDLVRPGAVFYLTLYKRSVPSVENIQELRFRRRPSWTATQLSRIEKDAAIFLSKMRVLPSAR